MTAQGDLDELVRARRVLLRTPLLVADLHPREYRLVVRRLPTLRTWFADRLGWQLDHDRGDRVVRLRRTTEHAPPLPPISTRRSPLTARRLALALVTAGLLAEHPAVASVTAVALRDRVTAACRGRDDLPDLDLANDRRDRDDLYAALRWLVDDVGALVEIDGDLRGALDADDEAGPNAILRVRPSVPPLVLASAVDHPLDVAAASAVAAELAPASEIARAERHRRRIARAFVDRPAVLIDDVGGLETSLERATVTAMLARLADDLGLVLERRAEGWAGIDTDPARPLAPSAFPHATSTVAHCALLLAGLLAGRARAGLGVVDDTTLRGDVDGLIASHGRRARWAASRIDAPATLTADATGVLVDHDLLDPLGDGRYGLRPLLGRYAAADPDATTASLLAAEPDDASDSSTARR